MNNDASDELEDEHAEDEVRSIADMLPEGLGELQKKVWLLWHEVGADVLDAHDGPDEPGMRAFATAVKRWLDPMVVMACEGAFTRLATRLGEPASQREESETDEWCLEATTTATLSCTALMVSVLLALASELGQQAARAGSPKAPDPERLVRRVIAQEAEDFARRCRAARRLHEPTRRQQKRKR